jgi:hypothetical protein
MDKVGRRIKHLKKARAELKKTHLPTDPEGWQLIARLDEEIKALSGKVGRPLSGQVFIMADEARRLRKNGLTWEKVGQALEERFGAATVRNLRQWAWNLAKQAPKIDAPSIINVVPSPPDDRLLH